MLAPMPLTHRRGYTMRALCTLLVFTVCQHYHASSVAATRTSAIKATSYEAQVGAAFVERRAARAELTSRLFDVKHGHTDSLARNGLNSMAVSASRGMPQQSPVTQYITQRQGMSVIM